MCGGLLVKAGKLTVIFPAQKHATFSGFIFEQFPFWEFGSHFNIHWFSEPPGVR
jgi:hypothetical protein